MSASPRIFQAVLAVSQRLNPNRSAQRGDLSLPLSRFKENSTPVVDGKSPAQRGDLPFPLDRPEGKSTRLEGDKPQAQRGGLFFPLGRPEEKSAPLGGSKPQAQRGGLFLSLGRPEEKSVPLKIIGLVCAALLLTGCAIGPDYQRPLVDVGVQYGRVLSKDGAWVQGGEPLSLDGRWWTRYGDARLNLLMDDMLAANADLEAAEARYRQAQATLRATEAAWWPTVGSGAGVTRSGGGSVQASTSHSLSGNVSWEPDLWGRVRRTTEAGRASLQASEADLAGAKLSLESTLAQSYFRLRGMDAQLSLLGRTVKGYEQTLEMTRNRLAVGVAAPVDVVAASSQLDNARVQLLAQERQRQQLVHAIAVLTGRTPASLALEADEFVPDIPVIPVGAPAELLRRRPDVAAVERRVAEANARIGVAQAAWLPNLTLSAQTGFRSADLAQWLTSPALFWSIGPALALTLFDGGQRSARLDEARASHEAVSASYRGAVLTAMREVEDAMAQLDGLAREQQAQARALAAAQETVRLVRNQYEAGMVDFLSVVQAENSALSAGRSAASLRTDRLLASVQLIAALGGGWEADKPQSKTTVR